MKINFNKFNEKFPFCINDKVLLFFGDERELNKKFITSKILLEHIGSLDCYGDEGYRFIELILKTIGDKYVFSINELKDIKTYDEFPFIFEFLNDETSIDITPEKIRDFTKVNKLSKTEIAIEVIENVNCILIYKLLAYLTDAHEGSPYRVVKNKLLRLSNDRFYNAIYQIILAELEG